MIEVGLTNFMVISDDMGPSLVLVRQRFNAHCDCDAIIALDYEGMLYWHSMHVRSNLNQSVF